MPRAESPFRDRSVAASLKRGRYRARRACDTSLPRPFGRGLIEATRSVLFDFPDGTDLPRPFGRGLIEAWRWMESLRLGLLPFRDRSVAASLKLRLCAPRLIAPSLLPRPFGRGLIEATRNAFDYFRQPPAFRDRSVAASLKPFMWSLPCVMRPAHPSATVRSRPH